MSQSATVASPPSSSLAAAVAAANVATALPSTKLNPSATPSSPPPTSTLQATAQATFTRPPTKKGFKTTQALSVVKPAATLKPPPASTLDPTLKEPISQTNKIYYDLVFVIKAHDNLDSMAIQCLYLTKFLSAIHQVDESAVLLPYKSFFALNEEVLYKLDKLGQSYTSISKYFQGFHSQNIMERMYVSILVAYNSSPEEFYRSLHPSVENLGHNVYTHSIQAPFISKIGWLFHSHEHTDLRHLTKILESILHHLNPTGPSIALGFQF